MISPDAKYARVLLREPVCPLDYRVPESLLEVVSIGTPVRVELGRRKTTGFVLSVHDSTKVPEQDIKEILALDDCEPILPGNLVSLLQFSASYYGAPINEMLAAAMPKSRYNQALKYRLSDRGKTLLAHHLRPKDQQFLALAHKFEKGFTPVAASRELKWARAAVLGRLKKWVENGWLVFRAAKRQTLVDLSFVRVENAELAVGKRRKASLNLWKSLPVGTPFLAATVAAADPQAIRKLLTLEKMGLICRSESTPGVSPHSPVAIQEIVPTPTDEQDVAIQSMCEAVSQNKFQAFLLAGVTGSGKTEVYLRVIDHALQQGKNALVLVPEIALTPQLGARFHSRFGAKIAIFHSALGPTERRQQWERIARGEARVGLGARSALFLPVQNLGVIIVDEEHEGSFKQDESPRYHARDLAVVRAQHDHAVVVLGSATPSLESWSNTTTGRYQAVALTRRVLNRPLPIVETIHLGREEKVDDGALTIILANKIEQTLRANEQAILFLNRRGFAPYVYCKDCGYSYRCRDCAVGLTLHQRRQEMICHYCGFSEPAPDECPECHGHRLEAAGMGTEKLEDQIRALFGDVPIGRLDRDTVKTKNDLERVLNHFAQEKTKLLIGTQMVTKGHDFPGVTLVGVINADASLNFPDFRAAERTFQLLSQVAGRAGRGSRPGLVLIQTYEPKHYAIEAARRHDYTGFVAAEMPIRQELGYPPYSFLALLRFEGLDENRVQAEASRVATFLSPLAADQEVDLLGPAPAPLTRLKGVWRYQLLIKAKQRKSLHRVLGRLPKSGSSYVRQILDVDPINML